MKLISKFFQIISITVQIIFQLEIIWGFGNIRPFPGDSRWESMNLKSPFKMFKTIHSFLEPNSGRTLGLSPFPPSTNTFDSLHILAENFRIRGGPQYRSVPFFASTAFWNSDLQRIFLHLQPWAEPCVNCMHNGL